MAVVKVNDYFTKVRPEDVSWLNNLSKTEIDMLVNLKLHILHRVKMIGHEKLAVKFDLKVLRAIAFVSMEYLKEKLKDSSLTDAVSTAAILDPCNLLRCDHKGVTSVEDLSKSIGVDPLIFLPKGPQDKVGPTEAVGSRPKRKGKGFCVKKKKLKLKAN